jgi:hypothetical protein
MAWTIEDNYPLAVTLTYSLPNPQLAIANQVFDRMQSEEAPPLKEELTSSLFIGEWSRCLTFKYQRDVLYRFGKFDDCAKQWKDVKTAMSVKLTKDEEKKRQMLENTYYHTRTTVSPTAGIIWELKETPGWD